MKYGEQNRNIMCRRNASPFRKARTGTYVLLLIGMLTMIVSTSFAWFSISSEPTVEDMSIYVNAPPGVSIATRYDAREEEWGEHIDFTDLLPGEHLLKPVTWFDSEGVFKSIRYGLDGRQTNLWRTLSDNENANTEGGKQYYIVGSFYARTETTCSLALVQATTMSDGEMGTGTYVVGQPLWNGIEHCHDNLGEGAEYAVRIGFLVSYIDPKTGEVIRQNKLVIYEPNADWHMDGSEGVVPTPSAAGDEELVAGNRLIRQTTSSWTDSSPAQQGITVKKLGEFLTDSTVVRLESSEMIRVDMYIWLEGQDADCYSIPRNASLFANVQFKADYGEQSGLVDIPTE